MGATHRDLRAVIARSTRQTRLAIGWTQAELGHRARLSRTMVGKTERAEGDISLATAAALIDALGIRASLDLQAPFLADRRRQVEPAHARCVAYVQRRFERAGWQTAREVEIAHGRSHGWIDLLAFEPRTAALVVNEMKTEIEDLGRIERTLGWYEREAWEVARARGWRPRFIVGCLLILDTERNLDRIRANRPVLATGFPVRAPGLAAWLPEPRPLASPARALALIDPLSRRADWLRASPVDRRRTAAPYEDYADFMRRLRGRS
ncbi:MAG: helix-turn-helix transcriptional regulator [Candidatus Limnocylindrales bacterium]